MFKRSFRHSKSETDFVMKIYVLQAMFYINVNTKSNLAK